MLNHPYYQPRSVHTHYPSNDHFEPPVVPIQYRIKRRFSRVRSWSEAVDDYYRPNKITFPGATSHKYSSGGLPHMMVPIHPPYRPPPSTAHPEYTARTSAPAIPIYSQPYPHNIHPNITYDSRLPLSTALPKRPFAEFEIRSGYSPRLSRPAARLPTRNQVRDVVDLPKTYDLHPFHSKPFNALYGHGNIPQTSYLSSVQSDCQGLAHMRGAWENYRRGGMGSFPENLDYTRTLPLETTSSGLVLPRPGSKWPPKEVLSKGYWMLHPCLLYQEGQTVHTPWKWDMNKYPTGNSLFELSPNGIVCTLGTENLDAPVLYPPGKIKRIKVFVTDLPAKPLEMSSNKPTVRSVFLALWEYLHKYMGDDWQNWLTKRHFQDVIPILKANRRRRIQKMGQLASITERDRPPKWIDAFGDYVFFGGLLPLDQHPQGEIRHFKLLHVP